MSAKNPLLIAEIKAQFEKYLSIPESHIHLKPLSPGLTSQSFRVDINQHPTYVIRVPAQHSHQHGINRKTEAAYAKTAAKLGIGFEVIDYWPAEERLITKFVAGQHLETMDEIEPSLLYVILETLFKLHNGPHPSDAGYFYVFDAIRLSIQRAKEFNVNLPYETQEALEQLNNIESAIKTRKTILRPCHNDLLPGNFLEHKDDLFLLDWEYAGSGDIFFDLGNLSVNFELSDEGSHRLLEGYFEQYNEADFAHFQLMRMVSDAREAFWSFLQSAIPTIDNDYIGYGKTYLLQFLNDTNSNVFTESLKNVRKTPIPTPPIYVTNP